MLYATAYTEVAALLQAARDPMDAVLVLLGAHAGVRAQECADLRWADVYLARWDLVVRRGKGGKQRPLWLNTGSLDDSAPRVGVH